MMFILSIELIIAVCVGFAIGYYRSKKINIVNILSFLIKQGTYKIIINILYVPCSSLF